MTKKRVTNMWKNENSVEMKWKNDWLELSNFNRKSLFSRENLKIAKKSNVGL